MLRSFLVYMSKASWARHIVSQWKFARRAASRFVAGEQLEDAIAAIKILNDKGLNATLDHLGEHTTNPHEAKQATNEILRIIDSIGKAKVRSNVSIKLSQIGLELDDDLCLKNLSQILDYANDNGNFVRIDMEDSTCVDKTLELFHYFSEQEHYKNTGVGIQSYLYRSEDDIRRIMNSGGKVRLCKGAYKEPASVAFPKKRDVDANFDRLTELIICESIKYGPPVISDDGVIPPITAVATHDPKRLEFAKKVIRKLEIPLEAVEFQMLYGIRRDLQEQTVVEGYPVRVYVPYGTEWYPYFVRRLAERPANLWFFISNLFRQ